jgi:hypothetical protein
MASKHQVTCINKSDRFNPHERIRAIGGLNPDGTNWKLSQQDAIRGIEAGTWAFYVSVKGRTVNIIVAISRFGHKYQGFQGEGARRR